MTTAYSIVGTNFTGTSESFMMELRPGEPATLVREPANPHDPNAIAVYIKGRRVGYIPKKQNAMLAAFIDQTGVSTIMDGTPENAAKDIMGMDNDLQPTKSIPAKFARSPNSGFPQVVV